MIASFKSGRDGIADALGIDDCRFITHPWVHTETGGYIKVSITGGPDDWLDYIAILFNDDFNDVCDL